MDIRKIEYFIKVAENLNYSKTAEQLHISHQALSKQIQQLELDLGARLFERTTTKVTLTEVGRKLYEVFEPIVRQMYQGYDEVAAFIRYKKETLRIGYFSALSYGRLIEPVLQFLQGEMPEVRIELLATDVGLERTLLAQDSIDVAISLRFDAQEWEQFSQVVLKEEKLKLIVSDKHPWYEKERITVADLVEGRMLVYENRPKEGAGAFFDELAVKERVHVRNADSYMNTLRRGEHFGLIGENYSRREGTFKLFDLPVGCADRVCVIAAFKRLHPQADVLEKLEGSLCVK